MAGKAGKPKWVVSYWIDGEPYQFWLTVSAVAGWSLAGYLYFFRGRRHPIPPQLNAKEPRHPPRLSVFLSL